MKLGRMMKLFWPERHENKQENPAKKAEKIDGPQGKKSKKKTRIDENIFKKSSLMHQRMSGWFVLFLHLSRRLFSFPCAHFLGTL